MSIQLMTKSFWLVISWFVFVIVLSGTATRAKDVLYINIHLISTKGAEKRSGL